METTAPVQAFGYLRVARELGPNREARWSGQLISCRFVRDRPCHENRRGADEKPNKPKTMSCYNTVIALGLRLRRSPCCLPPPQLSPVQWAWRSLLPTPPSNR